MILLQLHIDAATFPVHRICMADERGSSQPSLPDQGRSVPLQHPGLKHGNMAIDSVTSPNLFEKNCASVANSESLAWIIPNQTMDHSPKKEPCNKFLPPDGSASLARLVWLGLNCCTSKRQFRFLNAVRIILCATWSSEPHMFAKRPELRSCSLCSVGQFSLGITQFVSFFYRYNYNAIPWS